MNKSEKIYKNLQDEAKAVLRETAISTYTGKEKRSQINDLRKKK